MNFKRSIGEYAMLRTTNLDLMNKKAYIQCPCCGKDAEVNTSVVLTTDPPKYSYTCNHCGHYSYIYCHELLDKELCEIPQPDIQTGICTPCLVCGESVEVQLSHNGAALCDKCKKAILKLRNMLEDKEND